jgi:hypothetical protein
MTSTFHGFNIFVENLGNKTELLSSGGDTIKVMLTDSAPVATNTVKSNITQIASGNGYTTDGNAATVTSWTQTSGTLKWIVASPTAWTCITGPMGPFRYAVIYDSTTTRLIGWWDYSAECTLQIADTFTVTLDGTNGVLQITTP